MPLHTKYRPPTFDDMLGNDETIATLQSRLYGPDPPHSYLFIGPSGCGKTTLGRIMVGELQCAPIDFHEHNTANTRGIDTIRQITQDCMYAPLESEVKVYLMDEVHKLTNEAQSALLKILEDTPAHVYFILCTTDPEKLLETIITRCSIFSVRRLIMHDIAKLLDSVLKKEGITNFPDSIINKITEASMGIPRSALVYLDSVIELTDEQTALKVIESHYVDKIESIEICRILIETQQGRWKRLIPILKSLEKEPEDMRYAILGYFDSIILSGGDDRIIKMMSLFLDSYMYQKKSGLIYSCYMACKL